MVKNRNKPPCVNLNNVGRAIFSQTMRYISPCVGYMESLLPNISSYTLYIEYNQTLDKFTKSDFICEYCKTSCKCFVELALHYELCHTVRSYYLLKDSPYLFILQDSSIFTDLFYYRRYRNIENVIQTVWHSYNLDNKQHKQIREYLSKNYNIKPKELLPNNIKKDSKMKQNRVFIHSLTNEPYLIDENILQTSNDSEDELDTSWIVEIEEKVRSS